MVGTSHHYTADNIRALVAEYKALESGAPEAVERYSNSDHRTRAGVLWRVISALADEVPFAPAMDGGEDAEQERPVQRMEGWTDTRYIAELENVARLLRRDREKLHRVRDALSEKGGR